MVLGHPSITVDCSKREIYGSGSPWHYSKLSLEGNMVLGHPGITVNCP